jgi:hypothetical protein
MFLFITGIFTVSNTYSQGFINFSNEEKDSIKFIDYINRDYQFLNADFKILKNQLLESKNIFLLDRLGEQINYNDSLRIILEYNLDNSYAIHLAYHRILKTWVNVGYYLWMNAKEVKVVAAAFDIDHPYLFYEFLIDQKRNKLKTMLLDDLKIKISDTSQQFLKFETNKELLYYAFKKNSERLKDMRAYVKKKGVHKH